jgi:tRNA (adenine57-N1/adenine58-N1)-methyltransferase
LEHRSASHGERVLLLTEKGNRYLVTLKRGERFHSEDGVISHDDLAGKPYGSVVTSSTGTKVALLYPQVYDLLASLPRKTQIAAGVR